MKILIFLFIFALLQSSRSYSDISLANLDQSQGITLSSQISGGALGNSVRTAGDFNGDGCPDVIIGSSSANANSGVAFVVFGSASGLSNLDISSGMTASQGMVINSESTGDQLGISVSYAGDVNGDGIDDIIVGASKAQGGKGVVYVIYGSKTLPLKIDLAAGLDQSQGFLVVGSGSSDNLGASVSYAGDVNNDKIADLIIGATGAESGKGACYVIFGKEGSRNQMALASGLSSSEGFLIKGVSSSTFFGFSASNAGDIDGDGIGDIIIGAFALNRKGVVYVIYGKESAFGTIDLASGLSQSEGFSIIGKSNSAQLGYSVRNAGDFNGDGKADVIIGSEGEDTSKGAAYVIFGKERSSLLNIDLSSGLDSASGVRIVGTTTYQLLGMSVSGAGDINNDGIDDILIGVPAGNAGTGAAYVIFGSKSFGSSEIVPANGLTPNDGFSILGITANDFLGVSVSSVGDMNGDGMPDIIVGANGANGGTGAAYLLFSKLVCPENCTTCSTTKKCVTCKDGFGLFDFGCLEECPVGTDLINGICVTPSKPVTTPLKTPLGTASEVSKGLFDSGSTASRIFTMGRSLSVSLGLLAKIIQNVRFLNIDYPEEALNAFETYGTDLFELPIPETFYESPETNELSTQYARYDMEPTFLENYWDTIMMILISLTCFLLIKLLQLVTKGQDKESLFQVALKNIGQTAANFLIIQIYSNLDDVIFFLILDISSTKMNSSSAGISLGMGIFFLLLGLFLVVFHCWLLGRYQKEKHEGNLERFEAKFRIFGTLFEDFKDDSAAKQSFFWILIFRCIFLVLINMLLQPPYMQAILLMLTNLIFLGYFIYYRPFKSLFDEISQYFCELTVFAAYLCVLILSILDAEDVGKSSLRNGLGKCIVIAGIVLALGGFIIQMIQTVGAIIAICKFLRSYYKKDTQVSVFDQSQNLQIASRVSETSAILKNTSIIHLNDQIELLNNSRRNRRIPLQKLKCTTNNDLEISTVSHGDTRDQRSKLPKNVGHRVNLPKKEEEEESKEIVTDKTKTEVWTRPMGSRLYRDGGPSNSYMGLSQTNNHVMRRRKIKRNAILPNFSMNDDV